MSLYLRKSWVPRECLVCKCNMPPYRTSQLSLAGSFMWGQSVCFSCTIKEVYSQDMLKYFMYRDNPFMGLFKELKKEEFQGGYYPIPLNFRNQS